MNSIDDIRSFVFKNTATVKAYSMEQAKDFLRNNLKIDNNVEELKRKETEDGKFSLKYWDVYTDEDIDNIVETDYNKAFAYIEESELLDEDIPFVYDTKPCHNPPLVSLHLSRIIKYDSYRNRLSKIEIPSISYHII